jgi:hypothetical protein
MPLALTVNGVLFADDFARPDGTPLGANYTIVSGNWQILGGKLFVNPSTGNEQIIVSAVAARRDVHVQAIARRSTLALYAGAMLRRTGAFFYQLDTGSNTDGDVDRPRYYANVNGGYFRIAVGAAGQSGIVGAASLIKHSAFVTIIRAFVNGLITNDAVDANPVTQVNGDIRLYCQYGGANPGGSATFEKLVITSSRIVTVTGLPAGWKIRAGGLTSAAVVGAGAATLDIADVQFPAALDILDGAGAVSETFVAGVNGGDSYAWTPIVVPAPWQPADVAPASGWLRSDDMPGMRSRVWRLPAQTYAAANAFDYTRQDPEVEVWSPAAAIDFGAIAGQSTFLALLHEFTLIPKAHEVFDIAVSWDDGMRIYADGKLVWDNFGDGFGVFHFNLDFTDGEPKRIRVEQVQGPGVHHFGWAWSSASVAAENIPALYLIPRSSFIGADAAPVSLWAPA